MKKIELVYVTYIRTTAQKLWDAITKPEFARQYWGGGENISDWKKGSEWRHIKADPASVAKGTGEQRPIRVLGQVLESTPPRRLVLSWADPSEPSATSRVAFEIEPIKDMVCLKVTHGELDPDSAMAGRVSQGWPLVLSSMKSYLETGESLNVLAVQTCGDPESSDKEVAMSR